MYTFLRAMTIAAIPPIANLVSQRDKLAADLAGANKELASLKNEIEKVIASPDEISQYIDKLPEVLQYRRAHFETFGRIAPGRGLPAARSWPDASPASYAEKLTKHLNLAGKGVEIGPLNIPILTKDTCSVLYADHLDTEGLRQKYTTIPDIVPVDRVMHDGKLSTALKNDAPVDFVLASQVMEHVPDPINWLQDVASVLRIGGRCAISLPDRRLTFDFYRDTTNAADMVAAYYGNNEAPDVRAVYDHHSQAAFVSMPWASESSMFSHEIVESRGEKSPPLATLDHMSRVKEAMRGDYLDVHVWVFTPVSFLMTMAQLASDGLMPLMCRQFYPTDANVYDRGNSSFTAVLEKPSPKYSQKDIANSFLMALGE